MAHFKKSVFLILATCLFLFSLKAQDKKYRSVNLDIYDGLSQSLVTKVLKDAQGFLWIGTGNGLNRFDGKHFKKIYHRPQQPNSILGSSILGMQEDSLHNIWVGTDRGISCYDLIKEKFTNFLPSDSLNFDGFIIPFWATKDDVYAVEQRKWIVSYNIHTFKKRRLQQLMPSDSILQGPAISSGYYDEKTNSVWMGRPSQQSLIQIFLSTGKRKTYGWSCYKKIPGHQHALENLCFDPERQCFWFNTGDGLLRFNLAEQKFQRIDVLDKLTDLLAYLQLYKDHYWVGIDQDDRGRLWIATVQKGLVIYDPATEQAEPCFVQNSAQQAIISNFNLEVYCDQNGMVWCGYWQSKGLYQIIPYHQVATRFAPNTNIINVIQGLAGQIWMGTPEGILTYDQGTHALQFLKQKDLPGINQEMIVPIKVDEKQQKAWLHATQVYEMDLRSRQCRPLVFCVKQRVVNPHFIRRVHPFQNGGLTTAAYEDKIGIFEFDASNNQAHEVLSFPASSIDGLFTTPVFDKWLFLKRPSAMGNLSYVYQNGEWVKIKTPLDQLNWISIYYNPQDDTFWVSAEKQLIHFDKNFLQLQVFSPEDGLPGLDLARLITDNKGGLWFHTDRSIHQLDPQTGTMVTLTEKDGFERQSFELGGRAFKDQQGLLYFPSGFFIGAGFDIIDPRQFQYHPSAVYVQSLRVNNAPFISGLGPNSVRNLSLRYDQNQLSFEVGAIDFYSKGKNTIRYRLKGLNESWNYISNYNTFRYENLPAGNYTLIIQASNSSNEFSGLGRQIAIHIAHPWWNTWWAYTFYVLLAGTSVWSYNLYRSRQLIQKNQQLEANVTQRTLELNQSLENLRATQTQLIQSEKLASLGELTAGIAHEIQNPLNFVNNFAEVSAEMLEEMAEELHKGDTDEALAIATDLKLNLTKINHHGKRAASIVKGMLEHSRSSSSVKEPTDLNLLAEEYFRLAYHGFRTKDSSFQCEMKTALDAALPKVAVVSQDIGRVLLNLFNNAFYAVAERSKSSVGVTSSHADTTTPTYRPTVTVSTKQLGNAVEIRVQDNGKGIPEGIREKIFQPFFTTKPTGQGTGLGLSLAYDIITKGHLGGLEVESQDGIGTTMIIRLPLA